ncbi:MAG: DUF262 domain-containing protein [Patescibacteria group bacterium]|nr:DUF262 domain-containing protein [Patescibacteria group bacterium]
MINNVQKYTPADIFNPDKDVRFIIPKYQREYTWRRDNWDSLIDDISENPEGHFIGSIICINKTGDTLETQELELVDGQQRLTTLSLLYAAIYKRLSESEAVDEDLKFELHNLRNRILLKSTTKPRIQLSVQNNNELDFMKALDVAGLIEFSDKNANWGNRVIAKAFRHYYENRLKDMNKAELLKLLRAINSTLLVKIEVSSASDAFMLFESLNNRGVPLSPIDLVKNNLLAKLEKQGNDINEAFIKWNLIISYLPEESDQERFLRQYYNGFKYDKSVAVQGKAKATRSNLIKIYDELINRDVNTIFDELVNKAKIYNDLIYPLENDERPELDQLLYDLVNVKAAASYTFLLYLFSKHPNLELTAYQDILELLTKWFIRRNLTDYPSTNKVDAMFINMIHKIENKEMSIDIKEMHAYLSQDEFMSTLDEFKGRLEGDIYITNSEMARYVLTKIEESKQSTKEHRDLWERNKKQFVWTIEHIFPEGQNIPQVWVDMISGGDKDEARQLQEEYVHTIGNLTLTGYNSALSNMSFEKKRDRSKEGKNIGYRNGMYLNSNIKDMNRWNVKDIKVRTSELVGVAIDLFKFENE